MQDFIGSVRQSLVFKPFGGFVEKIGSSIRKSVIGLFSKPSVPALPPIAKSDAIKVKKDDAPPIQWRKGELIGCGAFGRVYMGLNIDSGALLAIKQVSIAANSTSLEKTQAHIRELEEEVNLLKNLSHPNIIRYLGITREEDSLNILLEIVLGGSISSLLGKFGSFPESVIRMYTKQLLLGLEYLHRNGIMHRDIKGANILVDNKGCIKLTDFGASKKVVELATMTGAKSMKGTPYWMAPEVILQTGHSFSADIWSVGCTVIEMATGKPPWSQQYQEYLFVLLTNNLGLEYDSDDNPREETVKPMVDGGTEGFKGHARVIVPGVTPCFECTIWLFPPQVKFPLCTLAKTPRTATHYIEYAHLIKWDEVHSGKTFDPNIPKHMQWVYSEAVKRAELFGIPGVTYSLTQGVVKTIIPAIASTNAIISAACALETLKIASGCSKTLSNYLTYNGVEGLHTKVTEFVKDKDCLIRGPGILVELDTSVTLRKLTIAILDDTVTVDVVIVCFLIDTCNPWYCCGSTVLFFHPVIQGAINSQIISYANGSAKLAFYFVLHPFIDLLEEHPQLLLSRASVTHPRKNLYMQVPPVLEEMTQSNLDLPFFNLMDKIPKDVVHVTGMASKSNRKISSLRKLRTVFKDVNGVADMDTASGA
ncbi:hypothetical protein ACSBR1_031529 [Camellia fascicularis]